MRIQSLKLSYLQFAKGQSTTGDDGRAENLEGRGLGGRLGHLWGPEAKPCLGLVLGSGENRLATGATGAHGIERIGDNL